MNAPLSQRKGPMIRVSLPYIFELSVITHPHAQSQQNDAFSRFSNSFCSLSDSHSFAERVELGPKRRPNRSVFAKGVSNYNYRLGLTLLRVFRTQPRWDIFVILLVAETALMELYGAGSLYGPYLRSSTASAFALSEALGKITSKNWDDDINFYEIANIKSGYTTFRTAFTAELGILNSYFVTRRAASIRYRFWRGEKIYFHLIYTTKRQKLNLM